MELVNYSISKCTWISELLKVNDFRREWNEHLGPNPCMETGNDKKKMKVCNALDERQLSVAKRLNLLPHSAEFKALENACSPYNLKCDGVEIKVLDCKTICQTVNTFKMPKIEELKNTELSCIRFQKKELEKRLKSNLYRVTKRMHFHQNMCPEQSTSFTANKTDMEGVTLAANEVVLMVQIYRPTKFEKGAKKTLNIGKSIDQVFAVLGCQKLTALRKVIKCHIDYTVPGEFSQNPLSVSNHSAKDIYTGGIFYIDGIIYEDGNYEELGNYSRTITDWAKKQNLGPFQVKQMKNTHFYELKVQLGYPYLYLHQGDCEHILVFSDIRLLNPDENQFLALYPFPCRQMDRKRRPCMICKTLTARWITYGNKRLTSDPYFFCDPCFKSFNYTSDGKKIGEFRAHVYVDPTLV